MRKLLASTLVACGLAVLGASVCGCDGGDEVVFRITNNSGRGSVIYNVWLTRNSTAATYSTACSIPVGATVDVRVTIPAADTYNVGINGQDPSRYNYSDTWNAVALAPGDFYVVVVGGGTATIGATPCSPCDL
jgi:hypothetical protein